MPAKPHLVNQYNNSPGRCLVRQRPLKLTLPQMSCCTRRIGPHGVVGAVGSLAQPQCTMTLLATPTLSAFTSLDGPKTKIWPAICLPRIRNYVLLFPAGHSILSCFNAPPQHSSEPISMYPALLACLPRFVACQYQHTDTSSNVP